MIDFHSHILPGIDDGCKDAKESLEVIRAMIAEGTDMVCATPHYYREKETPDEFLRRRKLCMQNLETALKRENVEIKIVLGAEVKFFRGMCLTDLSGLCYENTKYILVEMPFRKWTKEDFAELDGITLKQGITPVLAHIDRYVKYGNRLGKIAKYPFPLQINAEAFLHYRKYVSLIRTRNGIVIGSDSHNSLIRGPNMYIAEKAIEKRLGGQSLYEIEKTGKIILNL